MLYTSVRNRVVDMILSNCDGHEELKSVMKSEVDDSQPTRVLSSRLWVITCHPI